MKTCPKCKQALPDDALFCPIDGTSLASAESDPLLGTVIADRYVLLERVGQGNSGTIYRGEHVVLRQKIAIKLLHHKLSKDEAAVDRFRQEAATLAQIDSDHIVRVSDFGVAEDGRVFFAMEYLEGETLAEALGREGKFKEQRATTILRQIGEALGAAHDLGYVHRDIRPRNIFLCERKGQKDFVKLLDFGLAKLMEVPKGAKTALGTTLGDPRYMSPEQARGDQSDARSDIYSLAIIGYQMVTGSPPFVGAGTFDVLTKHLEAQPVPISEKAPDVSKSFADGIARALAKTPQDRYPSVVGLLDALEGKAPVEGLPEKAAALTGPPKSTAPYAAKDPEPAKTLIGTGTDAKKVLAAVREAEQAAAPSPADDADITDKVELLDKEQLQAAPPTVVEKPAKPAKPAWKVPADKRPTVPDAAAPAPKPAPAPAPKPAPAPAPKPAPAPAAAPGPAPAAAPASAPPTPAPPSPAAATQAQPDIKKTPTHPGFDPDVQSYDPASQTGNWFAEGLAAEQQLATSTKSGPLPAIYDALDDDEEEFKRGIPTGAIIGVVAAAVALFLFLFLFVFNKKEEPKPTKVAVATKPNPATENPVPKPEPQPEQPKVVPQPEPKVVPQPEPKVEPKPEPPKPKVEPKVEPPKPKPEPPKPKPKVEPKPKPKPKAVAHPKPKPKPKPKEPKMGLGRDPLAAATHVKEGRLQLQRGAYGKARDEFNQALSADPRNSGAHAGLGEVAFELGKYSLAAKHMRTAVVLSPRNAKFRYNLGNAYFKMGQTKNAVDQYRSALKLNPAYAAARAGLEAAVRKMAGGG